MAGQDADETVVVHAEDAATRLGHFVEQLDGVIDETGFDTVGNASAVQEAVCAKTVNHIRANA